MNSESCNIPRYIATCMWAPLDQQFRGAHHQVVQRMPFTTVRGSGMCTHIRYARVAM
jgi:hypothetical protein